MSEEELAHVSQLIIETLDLRHKNKKLREAIEKHKKSVGDGHAEYSIIDKQLWMALE